MNYIIIGFMEDFVLQVVNTNYLVEICQDGDAGLGTQSQRIHINLTEETHR